MNTWNKQVVVKGVSFFDGEVYGKHYKSGVAYIEEQMDERAGNTKGFRTVEYPTTPDVVKRVIHLEFPINADVTFSMKVSKKANTVQVEELVPIGRAGANPAAKAA